jgi:glucosylceramidase
MPCAHRNYGNGATVCVCNETHCDDLDPIKKTPKGMITLFETSQSGDRFKETAVKFGDTNSEHTTNSQTITIDKTKKIQKIIGFGGAFTDSSGINIGLLPKKLQDNIIRDYFSEKGIEYTVCRVPIAGSDFSTRPYTYADQVENDDELKHFNLTKEDHELKVCFESICSHTLSKYSKVIKFQALLLK